MAAGHVFTFIFSFAVDPESVATVSIIYSAYHSLKIWVGIGRSLVLILHSPFPLPIPKLHRLMIIVTMLTMKSVFTICFEIIGLTFSLSS
mgnify:CR=1 FL=1